MQILLTLDHSIDEYDAKIMAESFENRPWCMKAEVIEKHDCKKCVREHKS